MKPIRDLHTGRETDYTDTFKSKISEVCDCLSSAQLLADKECPYDAECAVANAYRHFRDVSEIVKKVADHYEATAYNTKKGGAK